MAARRKREVHHNPETIERLRELINSRLIIKTLTAHINSGKKIAPSRVTAGLGLLKKVLPDLGVVTHAGDPEKPIVTETIIRPQLSRDEWLKLHTK